MVPQIARDFSPAAADGTPDLNPYAFPHAREAVGLTDM